MTRHMEQSAWSSCPSPELADEWREECGVIGIVSGEGPAAPMAHLGLYALQHRGQ